MGVIMVNTYHQFDVMFFQLYCGTYRWPTSILCIKKRLVKNKLKTKQKIQSVSNNQDLLKEIQ